MLQWDYCFVQEQEELFLPGSLRTANVSIPVTLGISKLFSFRGMRTSLKVTGYFLSVQYSKNFINASPTRFIPLGFHPNCSSSLKYHSTCCSSISCSFG